MAYADSPCNCCGNPVGSRHESMNILTTAALATEVFEDALLTFEQLTTSITVLALHATNRPEGTPRVRALFEQLLETIH